MDFVTGANNERSIKKISRTLLRILPAEILMLNNRLL